MGWLYPGFCSMSSEFKTVTLSLSSNVLASISVPIVDSDDRACLLTLLMWKKNSKRKQDRSPSLVVPLTSPHGGGRVWIASSTSTYLSFPSPTQCSPSTHTCSPLLTDTEALHLDLNTAMVNKSCWLQSRGKAVKGRGKSLTGWNRRDPAPQEALLKQLLPCLLHVPRSNACGRIQHSWWKWHCLLVIGGRT